MATNSVTLGYEYFPDPLRGRPVFNGKIFVGEPDFDPEVPANQKSISIREEDGNVLPIGQPVLTGPGGVPTYNGGSVQILVDGNYSLKILRQDDTQAYYLPNSAITQQNAAISTYDTVAELVADSLTSGAYVATKGELAIDDGGSGFYLIRTVAEFGGAANDVTDYNLANGNVAQRILSQSPAADVETILIPTHFPTIQAAIDKVGPRIKAINSRVVINIVSGHALTAGFRIDDMDFSHVEITSDDATVPVSPSFAHVDTTDLDSSSMRSTITGFAGINCKFPKLSCVVDFAGTTTKCGYYLGQHAEGIISINSGIINVDDGGTLGYNIRVSESSTLHGYSAIATGGSGSGVYVANNGKAFVSSANLSNNDVALYVRDGSFAEGSYIAAPSCRFGVYVIGMSRATCVGGDFTNATIYSLYANNSSYIYAQTSVHDGSTHAVQILGQSVVDSSGAKRGGVNIGVNDLNVPNFNQQHPNGTVVSNVEPSNKVDYITESTPTVTTVFGSLVSVSSMTYHTIFDEAGIRTIHGGTIYGLDVGMRITVNGTVVLTDVNRAMGSDNAGNSFCTITIPPCRSIVTLKVEAYNRASVANNIGWKIYKSDTY